MHPEKESDLLLLHIFYIVPQNQMMKRCIRDDCVTYLGILLLTYKRTEREWWKKNLRCWLEIISLVKWKIELLIKKKKKREKQKKSFKIYENLSSLYSAFGISSRHSFRAALQQCLLEQSFLLFLPAWSCCKGASPPQYYCSGLMVNITLGICSLTLPTYYRPVTLESTLRLN